MPSILILGRVSDKPSTSVQVYTRDLARAFTELGGWDVRVAEVEDVSSQEPCDVAMIHGGGAWFRGYRKQIKKVSRLTASFMEVAFAVDVPFVMLRTQRGIPTLFPMPYALEASPLVLKKKVSLLLDHPHPWKAKPVDEAWCAELYSALKPLKGKVRVAQMQRPTARDDSPGLRWAESIPQLPYEEYLTATAPFTHFVMTHKGSYNGTVLDMAARGTVCMGPGAIGHPDHYGLLGMVGVETGEAVLEALKSEKAPRPRPRAASSMKRVVQIMNKVLRRRLRARIAPKPRKKGRPRST